MKKTPALIAAFAITILVGIVMLVVGANALFAPPAVSAAGLPTAGAAADPQTAASSASDTQIQQMQARIAEYQARDQQWQDRFNQSQQQVQTLSDQVQQLSGQVQQYQQLVGELQRMGVITIDRNGQVFVQRGQRNFSSSGDDN